MAGQGLAPAGEDGHEGYIGEKEMVPSHGLSGRKRRRRGRKRKEKKEDADVVTVDCVNAMSFKKKSRLLACRAVAIPLAVANEGKEMEWARRDASGGRGASPMPIAQIQYRGKRKSELGAKNFGSFSSPSALLPAKRKLTDVVPTHLGQSSFLGKVPISFLPSCARDASMCKLLLGSSQIQSPIEDANVRSGLVSRSRRLRRRLKTSMWSMSCHYLCCLLIFHSCTHPGKYRV
eukprot:c26695_g1_i4 orf=458-1156(-)